MTDATRAKVRAVAEALSRLDESGVPRCTSRAVRFALRGIKTRPWPWRQVGEGSPRVLLLLPTEASITTLARAELPGVVSEGLVWDCKAGAELYAAMERGS